MITLDEYDRVQILLGREGRPRPKEHEFPFTGAIRCGECGSMITAIEKTKIIKKTGELKTFVYYFCARRKESIKCSQRIYLPDDEIKKQIEREIMKISILPVFKDWALQILNESNDTEIEQRTKIYETQQKTLNDSQRQLDTLTKMRYRELIDDETFIKERDELKASIAKLKSNLRETESRADKWLELTEQTFEFALYAHNAFLQGDLQMKKEILMALGQNYTLKDQKLLIIPNEWLKPIIEKYPAMESEYRRLELENNENPQGQKDTFGILSPLVRG